MGTTELVLQEAVRAIEQQSRSLDELRSRAAVLLAASGVTSGFFAGPALSHGADVFGSLAILGTALTAGLALYVLVPRWDAWRFNASAQILLEDHVDVPQRNDVQLLSRFLAEHLHASYQRNASEARPLFQYLWYACVVFGVDICLWLLQLWAN